MTDHKHDFQPEAKSGIRICTDPTCREVERAKHRLKAPAEGAEEAIRAACIAWHEAIGQNPFNVLYRGAWCGSFPHQTGPERWTFTVSAMGKAIAAYLRARSSAPEAREGEAVAWRKQVWVADGIGTGWLLSNEKPEPNHQPTEIEPLYTHPAPLSADHAELTRLAEAARDEALGNLLAVIHGDGGHRALEVGTKQAALEAEKIVAGLFAAPSADKLRDHLEWIETVLTDPVPGYTARIATAREYIDQALAALKVEGA